MSIGTRPRCHRRNKLLLRGECGHRLALPACRADGFGRKPRQRNQRGRDCDEGTGDSARRGWAGARGNAGTGGMDRELDRCAGDAVRRHGADTRDTILRQPHHPPDAAPLGRRQGAAGAPQQCLWAGTAPDRRRANRPARRGRQGSARHQPRGAVRRCNGRARRQGGAAGQRRDRPRRACARPRVAQPLPAGRDRPLHLPHHRAGHDRHLRAGQLHRRAVHA